MEQNKVGTPVQLRESIYSKPGMGTNSLSKGGKTESHPDKNVKRDEKPKAKHPVTGDAPSEPSTSAPVVHPQARHSNPDASPEAGTRSNSKNPEKEYIPRHGGSTEVRGYKYPEDPRGHQDAKEDVGAHKRAVTPQTAQHPVAVPANQRNKNS